MRPLAIALGACCILLAGRTAAETPKYADIPLGRVTTPLQSSNKPAPESIPRDENVIGFFVANVGRFRSDTLRIHLVGSEKAVADVAANRDSLDDSGVCFAQLPLAFAGADGRPPSEWDLPLQREIKVFSRTAGSIAGIHLERIVERGGKTVLESMDAWADIRTRGIRLIAKETLPLVLVATAPAGIRVFLGREERSTGKRVVQLVVTRPYDAKTDHFSLTSSVTRSAGTPSSSGACPHSRVPLAIVPSGADTASIALSAVLPALERTEKSNALPAAPVPPEHEQDSRELRVRPLRIDFSVSQTAQEKEPVVAVSLAWIGRDQMQRIFIPPPGTRGPEPIRHEPQIDFGD